MHENNIIITRKMNCLGVGYIHIELLIIFGDYMKNKKVFFH